TNRPRSRRRYRLRTARLPRVRRVRASPHSRSQPSVVNTAPDRALRTQGKQTKARLLDAGRHVLSERGYLAARVDDVVRVAEMSHGTFYLYFANKEDLF